MLHINRWCLVLLFALLVSSLTVRPQSTYAQVTPKGQQGCAPGTVVGGSNLVFNGDFSIDPGPGPGVDPAAGFEKDPNLPNRGAQKYPDDSGGGGFSIQRGQVSYLDGGIIGRPFPGDSRRDVPPTETYFYSNPVPKDDGSPMLLWRQNIINLAPGTTYNFFAYFDNLLASGGGADPVIELRVDDVAAGPAIIVPKSPDQWMPVQYSFTTGLNQTSVKLEIFDSANNSYGDDFGMTQISLKQCVSALGAAKELMAPVKNGNSYDLEYRIRVKNYGVDPLPLQNVQITEDLARTFATAPSFQVVRLTSSTLSVNPNFNGRNDTHLLTGTDSLPSGQIALVTLVVRIQVGDGPGQRGPFNNTVAATAKAGSVEVTDDSTPGPDPDPNHNGDPKEGGEDLPTSVSFEPSVIRIPIVFR